MRPMKFQSKAFRTILKLKRIKVFKVIRNLRVNKPFQNKKPNHRRNYYHQKNPQNKVKKCMKVVLSKLFKKRKNQKF
jgi:hypothetical protein